MEDARLGILGGTFDPIHYGHLQIAEQALSRFKLDRVIFIPAGDPPHKVQSPVTDARDRYVMTVLATLSHPRFEVSTVEIDRKGRSYTVDTLRELHSCYSPGVEFYFILGADAVLEMHTWKDPEQVVELCHPVVSARPGFDLSDLLAVPVRGLREKAKLLETFRNPVSSTALRQAVAAGDSIRYLVPEAVESFIGKRGLYSR